MATADKLTTVAENVPKVYHAGQMTVVENAECLKGSKTDTAMLLDDVSPVEHTMGVKVHGKNLFDISQLKTCINSKSLAKTQTSFSFKNMYKNQTSAVECNIYLQVGTYYINGDVSLSDGLNGGWSLRRGGTILINNSSRGTVNGTITITEAREYILSFYCNYSSEPGTTATYSNIQLELGTKATYYEPYNSDIQNVHSKNLSVDVSNRTDVFFSGSPTTTYNITGSQLIKGFAVNGYATSYHITEFTNSNGKVAFKTTNVNYTVGVDIKVISGLTYTVSANITGGTSENKPIWTVFLKDGVFQSYTTAQSFTVPNSCNEVILLIRPSAADTECSFSNIQLEYGKTATAYVKYHEPYPLVVSRYGKNLWDKDYASSLSNWYIIPNGGGYCKITIKIPKGTQYTVSYQKKLSTGLGFYFYINNQKNFMYHSSSAGSIRNTITLTDSQGFIDVIMGGYPSLKKFMENIGNDLQIEISPTATAYEPYIAPTEYTPTANGTVEGVESLYPSTTLLTNDPYGKVYIDCNYYKDIDKTFNELTTSVALSGGE